MSFVISELTLEKLDNKHLQELFLKIRSKINAANRKKLDKEKVKSLQIDMCFIQRELDLRARASHEKRNEKRQHQ